MLVHQLLVLMVCDTENYLVRRFHLDVVHLLIHRGLAPRTNSDLSP